MPKPYPAPKYTIGHMVFMPGAKDEGNNPIKAWAEPVELKVWGIAPAPSTADLEAVPSRMLVTSGKEVYLPSVDGLGPHDKYVVDGKEWEQDGEVADYRFTPFTPMPEVGFVLHLKKVEG